MEQYELVVIGSGPAGEKAAVKAAYFGHKVALIEKNQRCGGAGVLTGTLPSKTLRETALYLSGKYDKGLYGINRDLASEATISHFLFRKNLIVESESQEVKDNLERHGVTLYHGEASFEDPHTLRIQGDQIQGNQEKLIGADYILIATGSYPVHPKEIPFDRKRVHDSDSILDISRFPRSIAILGAGVIGLEYATIFSTMGCKVSIINRSNRTLTFVDGSIVRELMAHIEAEGIDLFLNKRISHIDVPMSDTDPLKVHLESGEKIEADMFLYAAGRNGTTGTLRLDKIGLPVDNRENITVNERYQTPIPHIFAAGDVIGFPALASTSMDQGRVAVAHMFQTKDLEKIAQTLPYGIYTIPEISTIGLTEEEAKAKGISYKTGIARHPQMPRGKMLGAKSGILKLVFTTPDLTIAGIHIIGHLATELIHYGIELLYQKKTLYDVIQRVYNVPTLHELYKYAAYDGLSSVAGHKVKP